MPGAFSDRDGLAPELADELHARVKAELLPGERVLWVGRPNGTAPMNGVGCLIAAGVVAVVMIAGSALLLATYFGILLPPPTDGWSLGFGLFLGVMGTIVAAGVVAGYHSNRKERVAEARNIYAITDRRALLWINEAESNGVAIRSIERGRIGEVYRVEREGGRGDVVIHFVSLTRDRSYFDQALKMLDVEDARAVEELIRRTLVVEYLDPARTPVEEIA